MINVLSNERYNVNKFSYLSGSTIHDDAASNHVRYMKNDFKQLRKVRGTLNGVTGQSDQPMIGNIIEDEESIEEVVYVPNLGYNIDSECQLIENQGWSKDTKIEDPRLKRYYKTDKSGKVIERIYKRNPKESHFIRISSLLIKDDVAETISMNNVHESLGHMTPNNMLRLLNNYSEKYMGYTKDMIKRYQKTFKCNGCRSAKGKLKSKRLITNNYRNFLSNTPEGLDIDVAYVNKDTYLIAKSHQFKYLFIEKLPSGERFTAHEVREALY